jgi:hypothetical protein
MYRVLIAWLGTGRATGIQKKILPLETYEDLEDFANVKVTVGFGRNERNTGRALTSMPLKKKIFEMGWNHRPESENL